MSQGIAQETLAHLAGIERSHMGKIERGEHVPTLPLILKIARALKCSSAHLMAVMEAKLAELAPTEAKLTEPNPPHPSAALEGWVIASYSCSSFLV